MVPHENLCALPSDKVWLRPCTPGVTQAHEKCAMKMKERRRKNDGRVKFFYWKEDFIRLYQKTGWSDFDELRVTDSTLKKGTNSLTNE